MLKKQWNMAFLVRDELQEEEEEEGEEEAFTEPSSTYQLLTDLLLCSSRYYPMLRMRHHTETDTSIEQPRGPISPFCKYTDRAPEEQIPSRRHISVC